MQPEKCLSLLPAIEEQKLAYPSQCAYASEGTALEHIKKLNYYVCKTHQPEVITFVQTATPTTQEEVGCV